MTCLEKGDAAGFPHNMNNPTKDIVLGGILVLAGGFILFVLIPVEIPVPDEVSVLALSPGFWPSIISAMIIVLGALIGIGGMIRWQRVSGSEQAAMPAAKGQSGAAAGTVKIAIAITMLFAYYGLSHVFGIPMASMLAVPAFAVLMGEWRFKVLIPIALILPIGLYIFFRYVASVPIPMGIFAN